MEAVALQAQCLKSVQSERFLPSGLKSIQFLRFIAASIVVLIHSIEAISKYAPSGVPHLERYVGIGAAGVSIFFVISGFVMVYTSFREDDQFSACQFLARRVARIYPIYIVYALLYLAFYSSFTANKTPSMVEIGASLLLLPGFSSTLIGPGWTLSFEMYFYICFAIFMLLPMRVGLVALTIYFVASIAAKYLLAGINPMIYVMTNPLLIEFLMGAWVAYFVIRIPQINRTVGSLALGLALAGFLVGAVFGNSRLPALIVWGGPSVLLVAGLVVHELGSAPPSLASRLSFLGDSSYSLYLLHILLLDCFFLMAGFYFSSSVNPLFLALLLTILSVVISQFAYTHIERHLTIAARQIMRS